MTITDMMSTILAHKQQRMQTEMSMYAIKQAARAQQALAEMLIANGANGNVQQAQSPPAGTVDRYI